MKRRLALVLAVAALAACGGGADPEPIDQFDVAQPLRTWYLTPQRLLLVAEGLPLRLDITMEQSLGSPGVFNGQPAVRVRRQQVLSNTITGVELARDGGVLALGAQAAVELGEDGDDGSLRISTWSPLPERVRPGESGTLGTSITYASYTRTVVLSTATVSWHVQNRQFCLRTTYSASEREESCWVFRQGTGEITNFTLSATDSTGTLSFR